MSLERLQRALAEGEIDEVRRLFFRLDPEDRQVLRASLGERSYGLVQTAARSRHRGRRRGKVILLHGIMGANLDVRRGGDTDGVWVNYWRLFNGRVKDLALDLAGQPKDSKVQVLTDGQNAKFYLPTLVELSNHWHARPFAFDWRLDIRKSADELAKLVRSFGAGGPVHFVAHSMGGLVVRSFIQRHPDLWESCRDPEGLFSGGRLVQLGTPNHGSYVIPRVLVGQEGQIKKLALLDRRHSLNQLLKITGTFPGSYQMMPAHWHPSSHRDLYRASAWGGRPVFQELLDDARHFQDEVRGVVDPERFLYVAGYNQSTPARAEPHGDDVWRYQWHGRGDGRVTHELGRLDQVPTWYVQEAHGDLTRNKRVLPALHELLSRGRCSTLPAHMPLTRGPVQDSERFEARPEEVPTGFEQLLEPDADARRGRAKAPTRSKLTATEQARIEALLMEESSQDSPQGSNEPDAPAGEAAAYPLHVEVVWGDITRVDAQVYAVGHYEGIVPQNAFKAIDVALSGCDWHDTGSQVLRRHVLRGNLSGTQGRITFFPWDGATLAVAGMGRPGTFTMDGLRTLAQSLAWSVAELPGTDEVACVLIGSGEGTLNVGEAVQGLIQGTADLVSSGASKRGIRRLRIVELYRHRAEAIQRALRKLQEAPPMGLQLELDSDYSLGEGGKLRSEDLLWEMLRAGTDTEGQLLKQGAGPALEQLLKALQKQNPDGAQAFAKALRQGAQAAHSQASSSASEESSDSIPIRMSFLRDVSGMRVSAISDSTTVSERLLPFDPLILDELLDRVELNEEQSVLEYSSILTRLLLPREFRDWIGSSGGRPVVFELDRAMAQVPWETLHREYEGQESAFLALRVPVSRQLRTSYSPPPSAGPARRGLRRALVVGDPGDPDQGDDLPGAREEALRVAETLLGHGVDVTLLLGAPNATPEGPLFLANREVPHRPATRVELISELLSGDYDLLHYAGHGDFDKDQPERAGWLFHRGLFTGGELTQVDELPRLIVANACLSARTANPEALDAAARHRESALLASLADEFFRRGARHYVGTAWTVDDEGAITFAEALYQALLDDPDMTVGKAVLHGRRRLHELSSVFGQLWAAYQHYGDPIGRLNE